MNPTTHKHLPAERARRVEALAYDYASQPKRPAASCNLCGESKLTFITHVDRYGYPAAAAACNRCGLTFLSPMMTSAAYGEFYARVYRPLVSAYHGRLIDAQTIQGEQLDYAKALAAFLAPWMSGREIRSMLDIGGSTGVVSMELSRQFELKSAVLDPAADELEWARGFGMETIAGFLEDYDPAGRKFDLITLCQTIDHLTDAAGSLRKIRELISDHGLFFVDIVDFRAAYLRVRSVEGAVKIDHPFYFTEPTVEAMLLRAGFEVLRKSYAGDHLHIGYICGPAKPVAGALPSEEDVRDFFREVRWTHNGA